MILNHNGFAAEAGYEDGDRLMHGSVINTRAVLHFAGGNIEELRQAFADTIADYREWCKERGVEPRQGGVSRKPSESTQFLGATALTVIGFLMAVHAHAEAARHSPRKSENNTFVECTTLMDKCMPGTSSITKDLVCAAIEKHFKIRKGGISCK